MKYRDRVLLFVILSYIFGLPTFIYNLFKLNLGLTEIMYMPWLFFAFPSVIILSSKILQKKLSFPFFKHFLFVLILFVVMESNIFRENLYYDLKYIYTLSIIYILFIVLHNFGYDNNTVGILIKYSVIVVFIMSVLYYIGYLGFVNLGVVEDKIAVGPYGEERLRFEVIHPNGFSYVCVFVITLLLFEKLYLKKNNYSRNQFYALIFFFMGTIIINTSRGAFLVLTLVVLFILKEYSKSYSFYAKISLLMTAVFIFFVLNINIFVYFFENLQVIRRFTETGMHEARGQQIFVSLSNFLDNPWFGTGYYYAGRTLIGDLTRSNFSYTQILASHGIFYFILYFTFLLKFFSFPKHNLFKPNNMIFVIAAFVPLMFENLAILLPLSVIAYFSWFNKYYSSVQ